MTNHIAQKPYSNHPEDYYLTVVLHRNFKGELVTHIHNSTDGGYYYGRYHGDDMESAMEDFKARGR
jgi:hypothetical protein